MFQQDRGSGGPVPAGQISLQAGLVLAQQFQLLEHLGSGGMGHVWRARDARRNADVVLKFLPVPLRGDPAANAAMRQEYQTVWQMPLHPNICGLLELGEDPGVGCFQVMHFLAGRNLRKTLRDCGGPGLSVANVLWVLEKVAAALDHAHFHGVVHGDIKPDNIMLDVGSEQLHVIDFGLASASRGQKLPAMAAGRVLGSTGYLSPERQRGREVKAACDHWSLAVMTWELLTGGLPAAAFPEGVGTADVERVGELSAEHVVFQVVFDRAFAAESDDRYQTCLEFVESMRCATGIRPEIEGLPADGGIVRSGPRSGVGAAAGVVLTSVQTRQQPVRRKYRSGVILAVLGGVVLTAAFVFWSGSRWATTLSETEYSKSLGMSFSLIRPGTFLCGSPAENAEFWAVEKRETPQLAVTLGGPFYMSRTEVTQKMWFAIMHTRPWRELASAELTELCVDADDYPAVGFTWSEANEFCRKLSEKESRRYRMPTEFEWEFACRAGTSTPFSFPVPVTVAEQDIGSMEGEGWAAIAPEHLNYVLCLDDRDCVEAVPPKRNLNVGLRQPNPWGLHDMHGSVWELCLDGYSEDFYKEQAEHELEGLQTPGRLREENFKGDRRVIRGGSIEYTLEYCRSAMKDSTPQDEDSQTEGQPARRGDVGLRLVLVPDAILDFREQTAAVNGILNQIKSLSMFPQETAK